MSHYGENAIRCTGGEAPIPNPPKRKRFVRSVSIRRAAKRHTKVEPPSNDPQSRLARVVAANLDSQQTIELLRRLSRHHGHIPPVYERSAANWFARYAKESLSDVAATRYADEIEKRKREGKPLLR